MNLIVRAHCASGQHGYVGPPMNFITSTIAIGDGLDAEDSVQRLEAGIASIVCLNGQLEGRDLAELEVEALRVFTLANGALTDAEEFNAAVEAVGEFSTRHPRLLVHCSEGRSRSVMVVAAHLVRTQGLSVRQAVDRVRSKRRSAPSTDELRAEWNLDEQGRLQK